MTDLFTAALLTWVEWTIFRLYREHRRYRQAMKNLT